LKVLFPFVGDSVGGSHHSVIELYRNLCKNNISSMIVIHQKGPLSLFLDNVGVTYEYFPVKRLAGENPNIASILYGILLNYFSLYKFIKKNDISVVHGNDLRINLTWSLSAKISSSSYVWHQRTVMSNSILWKLSNIMADHFITISNYVHFSLPKNISESKKTLVLNPFNTNLFFKREKSRKNLNDLYSISKNTILFGYIGRLVEWKNVDFLIICFAEYVYRSDLSIHLIIFGTGDVKYIKDLEQLACKLKINGKVTFAGFSSAPSREISAFDIMIAPSNIEPFGRTLVEAMIQKTPVLAARGGGHIETIKHNKTGWLYDHGNIKNFTYQVSEILKNNEKINAVVEKAHKHAISNYSSSKHFNKVINIYRDL
jgi:glycosyltransferase involved in cell wall biosynthesis